MDYSLSTPKSHHTGDTTVNGSGSRSVKRLYQLNLPNTQTFRPYPGNPLDPIDVCVDDFFNNPTFELICIQAVQLAAVLPNTPPPIEFVSFDTTPMHHWYQAFLMEFCETFMRRLRLSNLFPTTYGSIVQNGILTDHLYDDVNAFNHEATAHINAILIKFNRDFAGRARGSLQNLSVDLSQPNAVVAALALQETATPADYAPKKNWRVGETLHTDYRRRLRMFEAGVMRLMAEREESRWILALPDRLRRGVDAYKEHYIACLREEMVRFRNSGDMVYGAGSGTGRLGGARDEDDVFA